MTAAHLRSVASAARHARGYTRGRDLAIIIAHENGHSLREIAEAAELSHSAIAKIIKR